MSFLFTSNPLASSAAPLIQRAPTHRRVVSSDLTPAQIQELLRDSGQFPHVGRFASEYSMDPTLLGKGTFGVVRRCRCLHSAEVSGAAYFAAKEIKYTSLKPDEVTDIINEVRCLGLLNHHHIVHLKEAWLDPPRVVIVEDLLEGIDGFAAVLSGKIGENKCKEIMWQLASAVSYCHSKKIVHRDIKLENLMLMNRDGRELSHVKLVDFGLATILDKSVPELDHQLVQFCGTPHYIAPEVAHRRRYGRPVDVWAMGVICYIMLSGETLWEDREPQAVVEAIRTSTWSFDPSVWRGKPEGAKALIRAMLRDDPDDRLLAIQVCGNDWLHAAPDRPSATGAKTPGDPTLGTLPGGRHNHGAPSTTFQPVLSSSLPAESRVRLDFLQKREYLHRDVSPMFNMYRSSRVGGGSPGRLLRGILERAIRDAQALTRAERGTLYIIDRDTPAPYLWSMVADSPIPIKLPLGVGLAGAVALAGDSLSIPNAYEDPRFDRTTDDLSGFRTQSVLCAPVPHCHDGPCLGVVQLINGPFTEEDAELLEDLCAHLSLALSRLYDEGNLSPTLSRPPLAAAPAVAASSPTQSPFLAPPLVERERVGLKRGRSELTSGRTPPESPASPAASASPASTASASAPSPLKVPRREASIRGERWSGSLSVRTSPNISRSIAVGGGLSNGVVNGSVVANGRTAENSHVARPPTVEYTPPPVSGMARGADLRHQPEQQPPAFCGIS